MTDEKPNNQKPELPRVRTYAADMARTIKNRGETMASIANTERTQPKTQKVANAPQKEQSTPSLKLIATLIGTGVLVVAGIGVLVSVFFFSPSDSLPTPEQGIIFANYTTPVATAIDASLIDALAEERATRNLFLGEVLHLVVTENQQVMRGAALAAELGLPEPVTREVIDAMIGVHAFDRNQPFIILKVSAYDRSFNAMLAWEKEMARALDSFFAPIDARSRPPSLSFSDDIIQNLDIRTSQEAWPILYTFPDQRTLIITTNEFTLREILTRLGSSAL